MPHAHPSSVVVLALWFFFCLNDCIKVKDYSMYTMENLTELVNKQRLSCHYIPLHDIGERLEVELIDLYLQTCVTSKKGMYMFYSSIRKDVYVDIYVTEILGTILFLMILLCICSFNYKKGKLKIYLTDFAISVYAIYLYINFNIYHKNNLNKFHTDLTYQVLYYFCFVLGIICFTLIIYAKCVTIKRDSIFWYMRCVHTLSRRWIPFLIVYIWCLDTNMCRTVTQYHYDGGIRICEESVLYVILFCEFFVISESLDYFLNIKISKYIIIISIIYIIIFYNNNKIVLCVADTDPIPYYSSSVIYIQVVMYVLTKTITYK
uniref:Protein E9B-9C n=1 Tax=Elephant endotheliotropic herpesvirus 4A TaxID=1756184 RepID=A0A0U4EE89_9BETA|nr:protein E9B-9C [Elephant endotheliotropic herpesvirus 4A]